MTKLIMVAALMAIAFAAPAQAHQPKRHHHHAAVAPAPSYPDSVMLEGKEYKVCKPGMQDDCVQAHQAGLGRTPGHAAHPHPSQRHR